MDGPCSNPHAALQDYGPFDELVLVLRSSVPRHTEMYDCAAGNQPMTNWCFGSSWVRTPDDRPKPPVKRY